MFNYNRGIQLTGSDLWLDAELKKDFSFVSHGHADHVRPHNKILATPITSKFHAMRVKLKEAVLLDFNEAYEYDGLSIQLFPAGHILGSAMIRVENHNSSLLYTGDFKMQKSETAEPLEIPHADYLIMESTFGDPEYVFEKDRDNVIGELITSVTKSLERGASTVVLAYGLGKAQEAMKILGDNNFKVKVHQRAWEFARVYEEHGVEFKNCSQWNGEYPGTHVLIIPPHLSKSRYVLSLPRLHSILLSGWAKTNNGIKNRYNANQSISFSDHADFDELLEFVKIVNPKKVFTTHGFDSFPMYLNRMGYDADELRSAV